MPDVQSAAPDFVSEIQELLGSQFGGAWILPTESGEILYVGLAGPDTASLGVVEAAASRYGISGSVAVETVQYSTQQLEGFYGQLQQVIGTAPSTAAVLGFGLRADLNKVELILSSDQPALVDEVSAVIPIDAVEVTINPDAALWTA